jgi:hypothetical protein
MKIEKKLKPLSWKAKRVGDIYCAPACGAKCTHAEFLAAHAAADALIAKCKAAVGGRWKKRVHENLGWHYSVSLLGGNITVHQYGDRYSVMAFGGCSPSQVYVKDFSKSLKKLVIAQLKAVKHEADRWNTYLADNMKALKLTTL